MAIVVHEDAFAEGLTRSRCSFLEVYQQYGRPAAQVDDNDKFDVVRAMAMLQVIFFIFKP